MFLSLLLFGFSLGLTVLLNIAGIHDWSTNTTVIFIAIGVFVILERIYNR
jgi:uncharacterized membrane protein